MKKVILFAVLAIIAIFLPSYLAGSYLMQPHQHKVDTSQIKGLPYINVHIPSESGSALAGWYIAGDSEKPGVLLMHGVGSDRTQMIRRAKFLHEAGYSVLLFDFQSHGESPGRYITFGYLESLDATAAFHFLKRKVSGRAVGIIGVSLGGASALLGTASRECQALIAESVYPALDQAVADRLKIVLGEWGEYLTPLLTSQLRPRLGFSASTLRPVDHLAKLTCPLFIISGEKDRKTTADETREMFARAHAPKQLWIVKDAGHVDFSKLKSQLYKERVLKFLRENLG